MDFVKFMTRAEVARVAESIFAGLKYRNARGRMVAADRGFSSKRDDARFIEQAEFFKIDLEAVALQYRDALLQDRAEHKAEVKAEQDRRKRKRDETRSHFTSFEEGDVLQLDNMMELGQVEDRQFWYMNNINPQHPTLNFQVVERASLHPFKMPRLKLMTPLHTVYPSLTKDTSTLEEGVWDLVTASAFPSSKWTINELDMDSVCLRTPDGPIMRQPSRLSGLGRQNYERQQRIKQRKQRILECAYLRLAYRDGFTLVYRLPLSIVNYLFTFLMA